MTKSTLLLAGLVAATTVSAAAIGAVEERAAPLPTADGRQATRAKIVQRERVLQRRSHGALRPRASPTPITPPACPADYIPDGTTYSNLATLTGTHYTGSAFDAQLLVADFDACVAEATHYFAGNWVPSATDYNCLLTGQIAYNAFSKTDATATAEGTIFFFQPNLGMTCDFREFLARRRC